MFSPLSFPYLPFTCFSLVFSILFGPCRCKPNPISSSPNDYINLHFSRPNNTWNVAPRPDLNQVCTVILQK